MAKLNKISRLACCVLIVGTVAEFASADHHVGARIWFCERNGGYYYVRRIGDEVFWFAQHPDADWAHVFYGRARAGAGQAYTLPRPTYPTPCPEGAYPPGREDRIEGRIYEVPKGRRCRVGETALDTYHEVGHGCGLVFHTMRVTESAGWAGVCPPGALATAARVLAARNDVSSEPMQAAWQGSGAGDLSGTWTDNSDGGTFYLHDLRSSNEIVWFAESRNAAPQTWGGVSTPAAPAEGWAHVFVGRRTGTSITGRWADVPKGANRCEGRLTLELSGPNTLRVVGERGCFGATRLDRYDSLPVMLSVQQLRILRTEDSGADEPRLEVIFVKVDGETVDPAALSEVKIEPISAAVGSGTWGEDIDSGTTLNIPTEVGKFDTLVRTFPGGSALGVGLPEVMVGVAVHAWEEDFSDAADRRGFLADWTGVLKSAMEGKLRRGLTLDFVALAGPRHFRFGWSDDDDWLGYGAEKFSFQDLRALRSGAPRTFEFNMTGDEAHYRVLGLIRVKSRQGSCPGR